MRIKRIKLTAARKSSIEESMGVTEEYISLKALNALTGQQIHLNDVEKLAFERYADHIKIVSDKLGINKVIPYTRLREKKVQPGIFTDFLFNNGADCNDPGSYQPQHKDLDPKKKAVENSPSKNWTRDRRGFWKEVHE